jgi:hypothetical protein
MSYTWNHWHYGTHQVPEQYHWVITSFDLDRAPATAPVPTNRRIDRLGYVYQPFRFVRFTDGLSPQWGVIYPTRQPGQRHLVFSRRPLTVAQVRTEVDRVFSNLTTRAWMMYEGDSSLPAWATRPHEVWKTGVISMQGRQA